MGGGLIGLAIALELRLRGCSVRVLSRDRHEAAGYAAAGMLAPQAEKLDGSMLDLCLRSRALYPDWVAKLESLSGETVGYWPSGILCPTGQPPPRQLQPSSGPEMQEAQWLDRDAILRQQPGLGTGVVGGWWFPQDAQVDNRRGLLKALQVATSKAGVDWEEGVTIEGFSVQTGRITAVETNQGPYQAKHYVLATGAWSGRFLELPVYPCKGQLLSLRPRAQSDGASALPRLKQVLYGDRIYIVPRQDGLVVVGATVEQVQFAPGNTAAGLQTLLNEAIQLFPSLRDYELVETWWGYRPATPDELPILGPSPLENLTLATGHYRNGVLLAPATAQLIADWVLRPSSDASIQGKTDPHPAFRWDRFGMRNVKEKRRGGEVPGTQV